MRIKKKWNTGNKKWPKKCKMDNGLVLKIPQQTMFGSFCKSHGCSVAAVSIALQIFGIKMSPYAVYKWCKENLPGNSGSKVAIKGTENAINGILKEHGIERGAYWKAIDGKNTVKAIRDCLKKNGVVLIECDNPIHTNCLIATRPGGVWNASNGKFKKTSARKMVKGAVKGSKSRSKQNNWFKNRTGDSGIVCVYPR